MDESRFATAHLSELDSIPVADDAIVWRPVRRRFDIRAFGVNAYTAAERGGELVEEHDELGSGAGRHEELYFVVSGHAEFLIDGETIDAPAGTFVFIRDPAVRRHAVAREPSSTVLAIGGRRGAPFEVSPWEFAFAAVAHSRSGEHERALELVREGIAQHGESGSLLYNLACVEALAGRRADALEHLGRAIELEPRTREWARDDSDFDSIREDPRFPR